MVKQPSSVLFVFNQGCLYISGDEPNNLKHSGCNVT